ILVNNAGRGLFKTIDDTTEEAFRDLIEVNLMGPFYMTKAVLPQMRKQKSGQIVNISSVAGKRAYNRTSAYSTTKFGLIGMSQGVRWDAHKDGIEVVVVCPPASHTDFFNAAKYGDAPNPHKKYLEDHPKDHLLQPEEVAATILDACATHKQEVVMTTRMKVLTILYAIFPNLFDTLKKKLKGK
ncbi:MAG: SDR family NAD(P)-dependent oxidoreductase, partial [Myxococcales bacterium]|nr:SDR family NAD(P)-dependent oxidoreductase [Myxococcales bacterium]